MDAADGAPSSSMSKRLAAVPHGPSSAAPTMTTRSAGSSARAGGVAGACDPPSGCCLALLRAVSLRGCCGRPHVGSRRCRVRRCPGARIRGEVRVAAGQGVDCACDSARLGGRTVEVVLATRGSRSLAQLGGERLDRAAEVVDARQAAAEIELAPARPSARARIAGEQARTLSSQPISCAENVRTPSRRSTSAATASAPPMSPVPRTQPIRGATIRTREPHDACSLRQRASSTSSAAFVSPYAPSPAEAPVVRRERQQDGGRGRAVGHAGRDRRDEPLHAEQLQPQRDLRRGAGVAELAGGRQGGERRDDRRAQRIDAQIGAAGHAGLRSREPGDERVHVGERREVRRQHVQLGSRPRRTCGTARGRRAAAPACRWTSRRRRGHRRRAAGGRARWRSSRGSRR